jgi:hypothetical protein
MMLGTYLYIVMKTGIRPSAGRKPLRGESRFAFIIGYDNLNDTTYDPRTIYRGVGPIVYFIDRRFH